MKIYNCKNCGKEVLFSHRKMNYYCDNRCQAELAKKTTRAKKDQQIKDWLNGKMFTYVKFRPLVREYLTETYGYKCSCCGIDSWNGKPITLWVDHIDGDATNNRPENFRLICPNCDSQSETFGAKNTGKGRKARGLPQYG